MSSHLVAMVRVCLWILLSACSGDEVTPPSHPDPEDEQVVRSIRIWPCGCLSYSGPTSGRTIGVLGTEVPFNAAALDGDGSVLYTSVTDPDRFAWSSSAPDVATVGVTPSLLGGYFVRVIGLREGTATVTATSQGVSGEMTVSVRDRARLAWSVPLAGERIEADLAIGADGTIYVVTFGVGGSRWFAVSPQGAVLWSLDVPDSRVTPAIGGDGTLYGGLRDGGLIAVSPGGTVRWTLGGLDPVPSSPAIGADGTVYATGHSHVYAVDPAGELLWAYEAGDKVFAQYSSPAVASDGTIYVGGTDGRLYAINPDGSPRWTFGAGAGNIIFSPPAIGHDGTIYFGSLEAFYAIDSDASGVRVLLDRRVRRSSSIGRDGTIHVGTGGGSGGISVYAIDPGGSVRWSSMPATSSTPILGADGTVYATGLGHSGEPVLAAHDSQGRLLWDFVLPEGGGEFWISSPAIGVDATILAVSWNPIVLYAVVENDGANGGYAGAPWPQARGNRSNNGRAGG